MSGTEDTKVPSKPCFLFLDWNLEPCKQDPAAMIVAGLRLLFRAFHLVGDLFVFVRLRQLPDNGRTEWVKLRGSLYIE